jgi:transposase
MTRIIGHDRFQTLLLPESLDDYVGPDNPVRFIEAFVEGLDLATAGFGRVQSKETGRPSYAPADLLKLSIYIEPVWPRVAGGGPHPDQGGQ